MQDQNQNIAELKIWIDRIWKDPSTHAIFATIFSKVRLTGEGGVAFAGADFPFDISVSPLL